MPKARAWPNHAENLRRDYIALALDIQHLNREIYAALSRDDKIEAARLNRLVFERAALQQSIMIRAHRRTDDPLD